MADGRSDDRIPANCGLGKPLIVRVEDIKEKHTFDSESYSPLEFARE
jgi:hypothetical protein